MPPPGNPRSDDRTVRVFISSTFRDMHAERDHLVTVVFPQLRERLELLDLQFFDVDLRWGIPETGIDGEKANSWAYCKQWINRVEPFFVCMLGQRYGYQPPDHEILDGEDQPLRGRSITELEIRHAVLSQRMRRRSFFYLRGTAVPPKPQTRDDIHEKFVDADSIAIDALKGDVQNSGRPARSYPCRWELDHFTDLQTFGELILEDLWSGVLRDPRYVSHDAWRKAGHDPDTDPLYTDESKILEETTWRKIIEHARPAPLTPLEAERRQMSAFAQTRLRWFHGRTRELTDLQNFIAEPASEQTTRLCVVAAAPGAGKSALLAKLAESLSNSPHFVITHFVGASERSADARSLLLRLIRELDDSGIAFPPEENPTEDLDGLRTRLSKRVADYSGDRKIVILLDALNQLTDGHDLSWLPWRLGSSVRIIASCIDDPTSVGEPSGFGPGSSQQVLTALLDRHPPAHRINLDPLCESDVRAIVIEYLREYCKELDAHHIASIATLPQARNPLYLFVLLNELRTLGGDDMNKYVATLIGDLANRFPDTTHLFDWTLDRAAKAFGAEEVKLWYTYLALGRVGMSSNELADLLERQRGPTARRTALLIERSLRRYLLHRGEQLDFFHGQMRDAVITRYATQVALRPSHSQMADYFRCLADPQASGAWNGTSRRGWEELAFHLFAAGRATDLRQLLTTYLWIRGRLRATDVLALISDYHLLDPSADDPLRALQQALRLSSHVLSVRKQQLPTQLTARLLDSHDTTLNELFRQIRDDESEPWLEPQMRSLTAPGGPLLRTLEGHTNWVQCVAVTPDGRWAVSGSDDNTLRIWDLQSGICIRNLDAQASVKCLALTPDGRKLVAATFDAVTIWDLQSGTLIRTLQSDGGVLSLTVTPDGRRAICGGIDTTINIWDLQSGTRLRNLRGHNSAVRAVAVTPDGLTLISGCDVLRTANEPIPQGQPGYEECSTFSYNGDVNVGLSWTAHDEALKIWDWASASCLCTVRRHQNGVRAVTPLPDAIHFLTISDDHDICLWEAKSGRYLRTVNNSAAASDRRPILICLAVTPDGQRIITGGDDNRLYVWDLRIGNCLKTLAAHSNSIQAVTVNPDGRQIISASGDQTLKVWDLDSAAAVRVAEPDNGATLAIAIANDANEVICAHDKGVLETRDFNSGVRRHLITNNTELSRAAALAPQARRAVMGTWGAPTNVWDLRAEARVKTLEGHRKSVATLDVTPDARRAVSYSNDATLKVWDLQSGLCLRTFNGKHWTNKAVAISADGRFVISEALKLWDVDTGCCLMEFKGEPRAVWAIAITPDARTIVAGNVEGAVSLWHRDSALPIRTMRGHLASVRSLAITPDAARAVSASDDKTLIVWDLRSGSLLASFTAEAEITACSIDADGLRIVAGDRSGHLHFLHLSIHKGSKTST